MAGYGLPSGKGFVPQLEKALQDAGYDVAVLDMAVSGNTAADALARVGKAIEAKPDAMLVEFGGNDALRAIKPAATMESLDRIIGSLSSAGIDVLLVGMQAPLNWGLAYKQGFDGIYSDLADKHEVLLYPFFLEGVATNPSLNLPDGIHPNEKGVSLMVDAILPAVIELIEADS